jgi:acyl carrier protein
MAAADAKRGERVGRHGFGSIAPAPAVRVLEQLVPQNRPQLAVVALDVHRLRESMTVIRSPLLSDLSVRPTQLASLPVAERAQSPEEKSSISKAVAAADPAARRRLLEVYLIEEMAKILQLDPSDISLHRPLNSIGVDSLMAVELRNRIEFDLPVRVQISTLLEGLSANDLVTNLLNQIRLQPAGNQPDRRAYVTQEINQLSDDEVRVLLEAKKQEANRRRPS